MTFLPILLRFLAILDNFNGIHVFNILIQVMCGKISMMITPQLPDISNLLIYNLYFKYAIKNIWQY